jgi:hypothetical protein
MVDQQCTCDIAETREEGHQQLVADYFAADCFTDLLQRNATVCAKPAHSQLRRDLIEQIW